MQSTESIKTPVSLLKTKELTASMKLVWLQLAQDAEMELDERLSPSRIKKQINVTRFTVRKSIEKLVDLEWYSFDISTRLPKLDGEFVYIPALLLIDDNISTRAKIMYGILLAYKETYKCQISIKYITICQDFKIELKSIRKAISELVANGWLTKEQANKNAPLTLNFYNPKEIQVNEELAKIRRRMEKAEYKGEGLTRELLSLIIYSKEYKDNATLSFLQNPFTDEYMQYDRYYIDLKLAFEFNGHQHYGATERYSKREYRKQRGRDLMKYGFSKDEKVRVVVIRPEELSYTNIYKKIGRKIKKNDMRGKEKIIKYLDHCCDGYRKKVAEASKRLSG